MQNQDNIDNIYNIIGTLAEDAFSIIYRVRNINNNTEYAARIINGNINNYQQELQMTTNASNLNNPNIIHLNNNGTGTITIGGNIQNNMNYLILDFYSKGDLYKYAKIRKFTEKHAKLIFRKILNGVKALHAAGICHRNLKLGTILLDQNYNPKISNFAFSTLFQGNNGKIQLHDEVGTGRGRPPQIFSHQPYNGSKADIFSLGTILFNLVTNRFGFESAKRQDLVYKFIIKNQIDQYWNIITGQIDFNLSQEFKDLYIRMVSFNENNRPTIDEILNDNWFNELEALNNAQLAQLENEVRNEFLTRENQINLVNNPPVDDDDE